MDYYRALGKGVPLDEMLFEKSPTYYKSLSVPARVKKMDPNTKIVLVVCNNVRRLLSRYLHILHRDENAARSFAKDEIDFGELMSKKVGELDRRFEEMVPNYKQNISKLLIDIMPDFKSRSGLFSPQSHYNMIMDGIYRYEHKDTNHTATLVKLISSFTHAAVFSVSTNDGVVLHVLFGPP